MQAEEQAQPVAADWRHSVAAGLHESGLLRAFQAVSRHFELASDNGGRERLRRARKAKFVVLGYHCVGAHEFPIYCRLPKQVFAEQMRYIKRYYRVLSLRQMAEELQNPNAQGQNVVVTFDDGYLGTYTDAFPILREYGIPATVYLIGGSIESGEIPWYDRIFLRFQRAGSGVTVMLDTRQEFRLSDFASRREAAATVISYLRTLPDEERQNWCESFENATPVSPGDLGGAMINWEQARLMHGAGISFGAHTMTHPVVSRLSPGALVREVSESKRLIEDRLGTPVEDFAFPFGKPPDCGPIGVDVLSTLGLRTAVTTIIGVNEPGADRYRLRRMVQGEELSIAMFAYRLQRLFFRPADEELTAVAISSGA